MRKAKRSENKRGQSRRTDRQAFQLVGIAGTHHRRQERAWQVLEGQKPPWGANMEASGVTVGDAWGQRPLKEPVQCSGTQMQSQPPGQQPGCLH